MALNPQQKGAIIKSRAKAVALPGDAKIVAILEAVPDASLARLFDIMNSTLKVGK